MRALHRSLRASSTSLVLQAVGAAQQRTVALALASKLRIGAIMGDGETPQPPATCSAAANSPPSHRWFHGSAQSNATGPSSLVHNEFATGGLMLMGVGALAAGTKWVLEHVMEYAKRQLFVRMEIDSRDDAYRWVMAWMAQHPQLQDSPRVSVVTSLQAFGKSGLEGSLVGSKRALLLPAPGDHLLRYDGRLLWLTSMRLSDASSNFNPWLLPEKLIISAWGQDRKVLERMLAACEAAYEADTRQHTTVHSMDGDGFWDRAGSRPLRPLSTVVLPGDQAEELLADCREFLASEAWYAHHGIPYRRGYLLHGVPGSGKTSLVMALAGALALDVYVITLSSPKLTDEMLRSLLNSAAERCLLLLEDVDAAFAGREGKDVAGALTFSGLLNAIDGVAAQQGRLLLMTTNHPERLSTALTRPGRVDVKLAFGYATREQVRRLFLSFYAHMPPPTAVASTTRQHSGAAGPPGGHAMAPPITPVADVERMAAEFSEAVPEERASMAALQGYLMEHKRSPQDALAGVQAWVHTLADPTSRQASFDVQGAGVTAGPDGSGGSTPTSGGHFSGM